MEGEACHHQDKTYKANGSEKNSYSPGLAFWVYNTPKRIWSTHLRIFCLWCTWLVFGQMHQVDQERNESANGCDQIVLLLARFLALQSESRKYATLVGITHGVIGVWNRSSLDQELTHRCHSSVCLKMLNLVFSVSNTFRFRTFLGLGSSLCENFNDKQLCLCKRSR